jgi:hypothetical protein
MVDVTSNDIDQPSNVYVKVEDLPRWIPVSERLPETRTNVLAYDGNFPHSMTSFRIVSLTIDCQQWYDAHSDQEFDVDAFTHWFPLPEPPEVK